MDSIKKNEFKQKNQITFSQMQSFDCENSLIAIQLIMTCMF